MSNDLLTVMVGAAGVFASVVCSVYAFRRGASQADRQKAELVVEIQEVGAAVCSGPGAAA